jgi:hypothetical protein
VFSFKNCFIFSGFRETRATFHSCNKETTTNYIYSN